MAGVYFIAAGNSSRNRAKSLDRGLSVDDVIQYLELRLGHQLRQHFVRNEPVFAWGATQRGDLDKLEAGDYVVDVKNTVVKQVFPYAFMIDTTEDTRLQEFIGWDADKTPSERRNYQYVYFLGSPLATSRNAKSFFQEAFGQERNPQWLMRQKWFSDDEVRAALERTGARSVEDLLGVEHGRIVHRSHLTSD